MKSDDSRRLPHAEAVKFKWRVPNGNERASTRAPYEATYLSDDLLNLLRLRLSPLARRPGKQGYIYCALTVFLLFGWVCPHPTPTPKYIWMSISHKSAYWFILSCCIGVYHQLHFGFNHSIACCNTSTIQNTCLPQVLI